MLWSFYEAYYARTLDSFPERKASVLFEYDASLENFSVGLSQWDVARRR